jgi:hypothetical protein
MVVILSHHHHCFNHWYNTITIITGITQYRTHGWGGDGDMMLVMMMMW